MGLFCVGIDAVPAPILTSAATSEKIQELAEHLIEFCEE